MIKEIQIDDIAMLISELNSLPNNFIFRGHADKLWKLESTLERMMGTRWTKEKARKFEEHSMNTFKSKYHIYNECEHTPVSKLSWLSVMQHYGVPTRLLDFTESPYIALYFALEAYNPQSKADLAIYAIDYSAVMDASVKFISDKDAGFGETRKSIIGKQDKIFDETVDRFSYGIIWITEPLELNVRIDRQAGTFLISGDKESKIEDLLSLSLYDFCTVNKYIIPHKLYEGIYALLRKVNINAKSIYGDLTGLAKSIKMEMQVYAV